MIIAYSSNTGFTREYAKLLGRESEINYRVV